MTALADKVRFLSDPHSYPHRPLRVEPIETHMSWVFLAGDRVYKFKKPVKFPFLDYTTLAAREINCSEEYRLNLELAADTYKGTIPLTCTPAGQLQIDGSGSIVEWLVEMERLPEKSMLDNRIAANRVSRGEMAEVADILGRFYHVGPPQIADGGLYLDHLTREHKVNRALLTRPEFNLRREAEPVLDEVAHRLEVTRPEIQQRIADGHIVEGHGDLRPEHVCLGPPVQIIDRLEFDRSMRVLDPYDEINYLGMECQVLGVDWIRPLLMKRLDARLGSRPSDDLMAFYGAFRNVLRARICMAHLLDDLPMTPEIWPRRSRAYLEMARVELAGAFSAKVDTTFVVRKRDNSTT